MKLIFPLFISIAALTAQSEVHAAASMLRIACEGEAVRAEVSINGAFKGECPIDVQVNPGTVQVRVVKKVDASNEQVFNDEFRIGEGAVKKIEVTLSEPRPNAAAQRRELARLAEERRNAEVILSKQRRAAQAGDSVAMSDLGDRYATGNGVAQSDEQASYWYRKAAEAGSVEAMTKLADRYAKGNGVTQSDEQALAWFRKAADAGNPMAMNILGDLYETGRGVPQSDEQALVWYRKAADGGSAAAMFSIGEYEFSKSDPQSEKRAIAWYRKAAEKGHAEAINELKRRGLF